MTTYKISFLAPRKASSLDNKKSTQLSHLRATFRKESLTKRDQFELPQATHLKTFRKHTFSLPKNKSTERHLEKVPHLESLRGRQGFQKESQSLDVKKRLVTKFPTARIYTQKEPEKFDQSRQRLPTKRSVPKSTYTQQGRKKSQQGDAFEPMTSEQYISRLGNRLTPYERQQMLQFDMIYYVGQRRQQPIDGKDSFDDQDGQMKIQERDHFCYRYEVKNLLGRGSFGQVWKCYDHKSKQNVALKIIKNKHKYNTQAIVQIKILNFIQQRDTRHMANVVQIKDSFIFRSHSCIVFEMLNQNLYQFLKISGFNGFPLDLIRRFTIQILQCLMFLQQHAIVHCDLKPQNILLKQQNKSGIKIIDFGSGCFEHQKIYTYIQSRFYRAPQIILGIQYTTAIDMWSLGCILCQLYMGYPIFPGQNEQEQLALFMEVLGLPPKTLIEKASRKKKFFEDSLDPRPSINSKGKLRKPASKNIELIIRCRDKDFCDFIKACLVWEPTKRMKATEGLLHKWILNGLPQEIRQQHLAQMRLDAPKLF